MKKKIGTIIKNNNNNYLIFKIMLFLLFSLCFLVIIYTIKSCKWIANNLKSIIIIMQLISHKEKEEEE
jgi:hypothetical protein